MLVERIRRLGRLSQGATQQDYQRLWNSARALLDRWLDFYANYNETNSPVDVNDPEPYQVVSRDLTALEERQVSVAAQRANTIDSTIDLTDRITVIAFFGSIFLTSALGFILVRYTNTSLKSLMLGARRLGAGDLNYRIDDIEDEGELGDLASAFNDMSDKLRNAITEVREAKDTADEANAAKSIFLANVSHELRTPLNAIIGYSEMLQDELQDDVKINRNQFHKDLSNIVVSGRQLLTLINDILDLSKIETGKMVVHCEDFEPAAIIRQVCDNLTPLLKESGNSLKLKGIDKLPLVHNDPNKFRQILLNLLSNASKFTDRGKITVTGKVRPGEEFSIAVTDTGIGMDEEQQTRIFNAFVQADAATSADYGGTGLGLAICQDFCQMMGGSISVDSKPGSGSTFTVILPIHLTSAPANV